ncbi:MAG: two component response regulator receiver protein [Actinomycetia bacterium]|jgi:CheY-like chemotaxis protein|nr:two component response regulator receiver protein [Actinomycetes bacterium]MDQ1655113.1 two-component system, OmpR family, alkaline phosphatase synthesis response regulator PhoP [Cryptosporangiaceae bacterium]
MATLLVVEDDADNSVLICSVLRRAGHQTLTAPDGPGALTAARSWAPDLIVLDVSLAGPLTGLDVCRAVRGDPKLAGVPVIMLSGWAFDSDIEAGQSAGADAYLSKPFSPSALTGLVEEHLARRPAPAQPEAEAVPVRRVAPKPQG